MEGLELYDIILEGFIEALHLHGVKEVEIPNTLTLSIAEKCIKKLQDTSSNNPNYVGSVYCEYCDRHINLIAKLSDQPESST